MVPSSAVMRAPTRPMRTKAVITGPSSRITPSVTALLRGDDPRENAGHDHQGDALDAHAVRLDDHLPEVDPAREGGLGRAPGEEAHPSGVAGGASGHASDRADEAGEAVQGQAEHDGPPILSHNAREP